MEGKKVYMVGIGGIGMSALAQLFVVDGVSVSGSDRNEQPTTELLRVKNIDVHIGHNASHVPEDADLIVYTDAIVEGSGGYVERVRGHELGIPEMNYFEALGIAASGHRVVSVSGTHGKTTTTAMLAKILIDAGEDPTVVVGSIATDLGGNFRQGKKEGIFVVEACEYRGHFLQFHPKVFVVTNIELDHTDYYKDLLHVETTFAEAIGNVVEGGTVVTNPRAPSTLRALEGASVTVVDYTKESVPELLLPGEFNRENARAAKAAVKAIAPHIPDDVINASLASFRGTWRRFEYKGVLPGGAVLYDDYAHHPSAIEKTIQAAKEKFPGKKVVVFFHPHLYSRTRDLFAEFARTLALADEAYILPVFAAREAHDESVSNTALAEAINKQGGNAEAVSGMEETTRKIKEYGTDTVVFTMGAGDVYKAGEATLK